MGDLKAGYVSFGTQYYKPEALRAITERAEAQLRGAGIDLARTDPVTGEGPEPERAIRELAAGDWDFLIANVINWIDVRGVMRVLLAFRDRPIILYSFGGFTEGDTLICPAAGAGCAALRWPMERMGFRFKYLFNAPDSPMDIAGILAFGRAARCARQLRSVRLGMAGFNDMGLYTTDFSVTKLRSRIGPEVESVDLLQLERGMQALTPAEVAAETRRVTANWEYPIGTPRPEAIERVIRLAMATVRICREKNFSGFSYKCVDGVDSILGLTHAVPSALVASAGIPYVDENDIGNLVAELMLKSITGQQVMFLEHYDHHPEWILLGEDGYIPDEFIDGKPQIKVVTSVALGGLAHGSKLKTGRMTLACLAEDNEGYRMHIVTGEGKTPPQWVEMGCPLPPWPSVKFFPDVPVRRILDHVQSQHFAMTFGTHVEPLLDLCRLLGITAVVDAQV
jgi:L-fucose isomerase-like protein